MRKSRSLIFIILFFVGIIVLNCGVLEINADPYENLDLKNNIISIETTKAGNGFKDLEPLKEILKDKKIVAMGEATHGTKEFFEMKHRMFEFLVEEMGYRAFAIEAEFGGAQVVNDYILNGTGTAYDAVRALTYGVWQTEEVLQMVEWMRNYNMNPNNTEKIRFYGFDIKPVRQDAEAVMSYLKKVDKKIDTNDIYNLGPLGRNSRVSSDKVEDLEKIFKQNKETYIKKTSAIEYEMAYQNWKVINQEMQFKEVTGIAEASNKRDQYMAENVKWILDYEKNFHNDKIMLWAHNGHVIKSKQLAEYKPMGAHLKEAYGDQLYVIGFDFYKGRFSSLPGSILGNAISNNMATFTIENGDPKTFAAAFEKTGVPFSFIDFNLASKDPSIANWLSQEQYLRTVGSIYFGKYFPSIVPQIPTESYDGLIFIEETTAAERMNKDEEIIDNGDRYIAIDYGIKLSIFGLILFFTVRFIIRKRKRKARNQ